MADRCPTPKRGKPCASGAAFLIVAALFTAPALAASTIHGPDNEAEKATLDVPVRDFITKAEDHDVMTPVGVLAPSAAAAIREAIHTDSLTDLMKRDKNRPKLEPGMKTRLPGLSDDDQSRYKKRMYRRDI